MTVSMTILAAVADFSGWWWKTLSVVLLTPAITFFPGLVDMVRNNKNA
jgi:hypothetical protein